jgi:hypothetical protein
MKRNENILDWLITRPWVYAAFFLFLSPFIIDKIKSNRVFSLLYLSLLLLLLYRLFKLYIIRSQDSKKGK